MNTCSEEWRGRRGDAASAVQRLFMLCSSHTHFCHATPTIGMFQLQLESFSLTPCVGACICSRG